GSERLSIVLSRAGRLPPGREGHSRAIRKGGGRKESAPTDSGPMARGPHEQVEAGLPASGSAGTSLPVLSDSGSDRLSDPSDERLLTRGPRLHPLRRRVRGGISPHFPIEPRGAPSTLTAYITGGGCQVAWRGYGGEVRAADPDWGDVTGESTREAYTPP